MQKEQLLLHWANREINEGVGTICSQHMCILFPIPTQIFCFTTTYTQIYACPKVSFFSQIKNLHRNVCKQQILKLCFIATRWPDFVIGISQNKYSKKRRFARAKSALVVCRMQLTKYGNFKVCNKCHFTFFNRFSWVTKTTPETQTRCAHYVKVINSYSRFSL